MLILNFDKDNIKLNYPNSQWMKIINRKLLKPVI